MTSESIASRIMWSGVIIVNCGAYPYNCAIGAVLALVGAYLFMRSRDGER